MLNTATIIAQPVVNGVPEGPVLTRRAFAFVQVVTPEIELVKTALVPVVLDPDAQPVEGPDVPDPRPAEYLYEVGNPGQVPIRDVVLADDTCENVTFLEGDAAPTGSLDPGEAWVYTCETTLQRQQATTPPLPPDSKLSGMVRNTADVQGTSFLPDEPDVDGPEVTDSDTASVTVIEPSLTLTKTVSPEVVRVNGEVDLHVRGGEHRGRRSPGPRPGRRQVHRPPVRRGRQRERDPRGRKRRRRGDLDVHLHQGDRTSGGFRPDGRQHGHGRGHRPAGQHLPGGGHRRGARPGPGDLPDQDGRPDPGARRHHRQLRLRRHQRRNQPPRC